MKATKLLKTQIYLKAKARNPNAKMNNTSNNSFTTSPNDLPIDSPNNTKQ